MSGKGGCFLYQSVDVPKADTADVKHPKFATAITGLLEALLLPSEALSLKSRVFLHQSLQVSRIHHEKGNNDGGQKQNGEDNTDYG